MVQYDTLACAMKGCHITFAMPTETIDRFRETGKTFYCPHGHSNYFPRKKNQPPAEVKILKEKVEVCQRTSRDLARKADLAERRLKAARNGHRFFEHGKWKGICPACYAEQPRGSGKKSLARAWALRHCRERGA